MIVIIFLNTYFFFSFFLIYVRAGKVPVRANLGSITPFIFYLYIYIWSYLKFLILQDTYVKFFILQDPMYFGLQFLNATQLYSICTSGLILIVYSYFIIANYSRSASNVYLTKKLYTFLKDKILTLSLNFSTPFHSFGNKF